MNVAASILRATDIAYAFGDRTVLKDISVDIRPGEVFGLLGPNGSGKSTLLSLFTGMRSLQQGAIHLDGKLSSPDERAYREAIGVVFQSPSLDAKLSVRENLQLVATMYGFRGKQARRRVEEAIELARLTDRATSVVGELSGGMRRRLDISRALLPAPRILLMDEPTTGLDEASYRALWEHLEAANRRTGVTIVVSTHRADEAARCDRLCVIHKGVAAAIASPTELCASLSEDLVQLSCPSPDTVLALLADIDGDISVTEDGLTIACTDGHALVPKLFERLPAGSVTAVQVRRPGLADAYLAITGDTLDAETEEAE